ncbi:hypothetical protein G647_09344, partial [Cladophialophora carrionii CBS 160.54]
GGRPSYLLASVNRRRHDSRCRCRDLRPTIRPRRQSDSKLVPGGCGFHTGPFRPCCDDCTSHQEFMRQRGRET